jgi:predicted dehydrogenase
MRDPLRIALIGIGGFAQFHYHLIKEIEPSGSISLRAVVIRESDLEQFPDIITALKAAGTRLYTVYEEMLDSEQEKVDLVVIPTEISAHCPMSIAALEAGYHVLCEKPVAGTVEECLRMKEAQQRSGLVLAINFQNIFSPAIQRIKHIALGGSLGALLTAKTHVLWPRAQAYYRRAPWSGKLTSGGTIINDCPLQNATAHFFNNMLYVAGPRPSDAAEPVSVYGENYRAKSIESCDTQFLRVVTNTGVKILFITTHATNIRENPVSEYFFEKGKVTWFSNGEAVVESLKNGCLVEVERFGTPKSNFLAPVYANVCESIIEGTPPLASIHNSIQHVLCVESSLRSGPIVDISADHLENSFVAEDDDCLKAGDTNVFIPGIKPLVDRMRAGELSFHEAGCPWAQASRTIHPVSPFPRFAEEERPAARSTELSFSA